MMTKLESLDQARRGIDQALNDWHARVKREVRVCKVVHDMSCLFPDPMNLLCVHSVQASITITICYIYVLLHAVTHCLLTRTGDL